MSIIAVDFDGTCVYHEYPKVGANVEHCVEVLKRLTSHGHQLILWTMRSGEKLAEAQAWFEENEVPLWASQRNPDQTGWTDSPKAYAHIYIDDAALGTPMLSGPQTKRPFVNWHKIEELLVDKGLL